MKKIFEKPFIGISHVNELFLLYNTDGSYSVLLEITNFAEQYSADSSYYEEYHNLIGQATKILGAGYILQKTDIIALQAYRQPGNIDCSDYLTRKYFQHFKGRKYYSLKTYLTITRQNNKGRFFAYDKKEIDDFVNKTNKVIDAFNTGNSKATVLGRSEIKELHRRFISFNFSDAQIAYDNIHSEEDKIQFGDAHSLKVISLIDIEDMNFPGSVGTFACSREAGKNFPIDNFSFLFNVPGAEAIVYNQVIFIPDQIKIKRDLEVKKKRHSSMPDPANKLSVNDIDDMFIDIAQENELLVHAHFSLLVYTEDNKLTKAVNYIDTQLFALGIIPGKNTYNQMELYRSSIPGNAVELKPYDKFLTSRPAAICFFLKERLPVSEKSDYLLFYTDRQGVPIGIDTSELPMQTNRINNRNKFILGPSGSGKSFYTNSYVKQCKTLGADIILVDTGHSYAGLCKYFGGKYITYSEEKPITMNPFRIEAVENNEEKRQILKSLVGMLWKGPEGILSQIEDTILNNVVAAYYADYFGSRKEIASLSFNSFYEFSINKIATIQADENIEFRLDEYKFVLKKFYKGGEYERILNDDFDNTLFNEPFIVFEIDSIKEHKLLFPIVTLIIMDVFIQKMRHKKNKKILIIEEAWKAIASPMMAGYIVYLYKTVRKFAGEAIVVTQELDDIIGNAIVKNSIIANSDTICLLDQSKFKDNFDEVAKLLSLTEIERNKIFTINKLSNKEDRSRFKEVYIKRGATGEVYGVEVPLEEYLTYTTERSEKDAIEVYLQACSKFEIAIEHFVNDLKASGLNLPAFVKEVNNRNTVLPSSK